MEIDAFVAALFGDNWTLEDLSIAYLLQLGGFILLPLVAFAPYLLFFLVSLPLRRKERSLLFLDLLAQGGAQGESAEQTVRSLCHCREPVFGTWLERLEPALERGESLDRALELVSGFLPPSITAQLQAGAKAGDIYRVIPACRRLLNDARSEVLAAFNYFLLLTFGLVPFSLAILLTLQVWVLPKIREIYRDFGVDDGFGSSGVFAYVGLLALFQGGLLALLVPAVLNHALGPELRSWLHSLSFPIWDEIAYRTPWGRKRMRRDFTSALATLLDAGFPEGPAVLEAARCTANVRFQRQAQRVLSQLEQGRPLSSALRMIENAGEFQWRLQNALASNQGLARALDGWIARLDALAFQQQQAMAQLAVSLLLLLNGLAVGVIAYTIFRPLIRILEIGLLW